MAMMITIVGCGPGALDHLPTVAQRAIAEADVLVGACRLLDLFPSLTAERIEVGANVPKLLDQMAPRVGQANIVVLVTGDPGVCSLAQPVIQRFGRENCRVIPGISSVQVAFARLGLDWFGARLLTAHERIPDIDTTDLLKQDKIAVLAGNLATIPWIVAVAERLADTHEVFACQNLTLPEEEVRSLAAGELASSMLPSRTVVLFVRRELMQ
jgi:precorrin-6y C5,15-methyltransferase (decarboxylating) CbiE subunit